MDAADLNTLCHLAGRKEYDWLRDNLSDPYFPANPTFYSDSREGFVNTLDDLHAKLADVPETGQLLDLFLLSRYLLAQDDVPNWAISWLKAHIEISHHFPGVRNLNEIGKNICAAPVVSVIGEACIQYFITCLIKKQDDSNLWPDWVDPLLDDEAKNSIRSAAKAATSYKTPRAGTSLFCYPLTVANNKCQYAGSSLGLPLAIGFLSVLSGRSVSTRLLATGGINSEGDISKVGSLDHKLSCACLKGFSVFLQPDQDFPVTPPPRDLEVIPVTDLSEAWLVASLHAPGRGQELLTLLAMLRNPRALVNNMDHIDHRWIHRISRLEKGQKIVKSVVKSPDLIKDFVDQLSRVLNSWNLEATAVLSGLISKEMFQRMKTTSPLAAFKFCTRSLVLNNHQGNVVEADHWAVEGESLFPKALVADINACADFLNNRFVSRHNRYTFEPELPRKVANLLTCLEKRYAVQCNSGCFSDPVLGELCGTIAQNLAFCGPGHITAFNDFIRQAVNAFGSNQVAEYKYQILREYCYQVYAYLDAGLFEKAESKLLEYLETKDWQDLLSNLDTKDLGSFQHAALARFLAESSYTDKIEVYLKWAVRYAGKLPDADHPWQLWSYNIGRMARNMADHNSAKKMYLKSFDLCMTDESHPTILVMALLPLAGLKQINALDEINTQENENRINVAAQNLDADHFKTLFENDFETILEAVWIQPQNLFPFTYR
jgi:hypothetical protein